MIKREAKITKLSAETFDEIILFDGRRGHVVEYEPGSDVCLEDIVVV